LTASHFGAAEAFWFEDGLFPDSGYDWAYESGSTPIFYVGVIPNPASDYTFTIKFPPASPAAEFTILSYGSSKQIPYDVDITHRGWRIQITKGTLIKYNGVVVQLLKIDEDGLLNKGLLDITHGTVTITKID